MQKPKDIYNYGYSYSDMATTIQVSNSTKQILELLKKKEKADSYDQVIQHLVQEHTHIKKSMFGTSKGTGWKKEDRLEFREL